MWKYKVCCLCHCSMLLFYHCYVEWVITRDWVTLFAPPCYDSSPEETNQTFTFRRYEWSEREDELFKCSSCGCPLQLLFSSFWFEQVLLLLNYNHVQRSLYSRPLATLCSPVNSLQTSQWKRVDSLPFFCSISKGCFSVAPPVNGKPTGSRVGIRAGRAEGLQLADIFPVRCRLIVQTGPLSTKRLLGWCRAVDSPSVIRINVWM